MSKWKPRRLRRRCRPALLAAIVVCVFTAQQARGHGDAHERIEHLSRVIHQNPEDAEALLQRGALYRMHGDHAAARADLNRAQAMAPNLAPFRFLLGQLSLESGDLAESERLFSAYLEDHPNHVQARWLRGLARVRARQFDPACRDLDRALGAMSEVRPTHVLELARAHYHNPESGPAEAIDVIDRGIKRVGAIVVLHQQAMAWEQELGRFDAALRRLDALAARSSRQDYWLLQRGRVLVKADRPAEARQAFEACIRAYEQLPDHVKQRALNQQIIASARQHLQDLHAEN